MQNNWKIAVPIMAIAVVIVAIVAMKYVGHAPQSEIAMKQAVSPQSAPQIQVTPVSGNVDDLTVSLGAQADADMSNLSDPSVDQSTVSSDSASINEIAGAYDENSF